MSACRNALLEFSREQTPLQWATVQDSLGVALAALGEHRNSAVEINEAINGYHAALEVFRQAGAASNVEETEANLAQAEALLAEQHDANTSD